MTEAASKLSSFLAKKKMKANAEAASAAPASAAAAPVQAEPAVKAEKPKPAAKPVAKTAEKPKPKPPIQAQIFIEFKDLGKNMPKLTPAQREQMTKFKVRRDYAANLKAKEARDELGVLMKPTVLSIEELFAFAKKYGVSDDEIKRWKKTPNEGTLRMSLGNRLRHLISKGLQK